jgi:methylated-DNA-protein-cysteine methyltransferase-like protein
MTRPAPRTSDDTATFRTRVFEVVARIPPGRIATYGDVARMAGRPRAARLVGRLMATATAPGLPYHRVVGAGGALGGYGPGAAFKAAKLAEEGVVVRRGRIAGFAAARWTS